MLWILRINLSGLPEKSMNIIVKYQGYNYECDLDITGVQQGDFDRFDLNAVYGENGANILSDLAGPRRVGIRRQVEKSLYSMFGGEA
jgi:hypothetical protein